jgi:hypothetical protein
VTVEAHTEEDGIDVSLIRWMLSLTPLERLRVLDQHVAAVRKLREINQGTWASRDSSQD